jgi:cytochrome P450 family 135
MGARAAAHDPVEEAALPLGPRLPAPVQTALWFGRPIRFMERCGRRYGDCFTLRLPFGPAMVVVSDPALADAVLGAPHEVAPAGPENAILEPLLGPHSVLMLDGPEHLRQRRLLLPFFHGERMRRHEATIRAIAVREAEAWPLGRPFPLLPRMRAVTFEVILRIVFGLEDPARLEELGGLLRRLLAMGSSWLVLPWMQRDLGPRSPWGRFLRLKARIDDLLAGEIRRRRADPGTRDDVLGHLLRARDEEGRGLSDDELRDQLMTLLVAGHETTATSLAWSFELLLRRPGLAEEVAGSPRLRDAVVRETLRLRAPFRVVSRRLLEPMRVGPHRLPAGVAVGICTYLAQRRAVRDPEEFRPERFLEPAAAQPGWVPFGGGVHRCLGAGFATWEMGVVLEAVLAHARLRPASAEPEPISLHAVILVPKHGARVVREA